MCTHLPSSIDDPPRSPSLRDVGLVRRGHIWSERLTHLRGEPKEEEEEEGGELNSLAVHHITTVLITSNRSNQVGKARDEPSQLVLTIGPDLALGEVGWAGSDPEPPSLDG